MALTARQERVLRVVIEEYIASGAPVGSKHLSERFALGAAPSTIRNDLAELEELGMLAHPHTSAGRVPTDAGYRHYVDVHRRRTARGGALTRPGSRQGAQRDRRRVARDGGGAVARHRTAGRGLGAGRDDVARPPHRGPRAAAATRHGRHHHRRRARCRSASSRSSSRSTKASPEFARVYLNEQPRRRPARHAPRVRRVREPRPAPQGARVPRRRAPGVRGARRGRRGGSAPGRHVAAASRTWHARAPGT